MTKEKGTSNFGLGILSQQNKTLCASLADFSDKIIERESSKCRVIRRFKKEEDI